MKVSIFSAILLLVGLHHVTYITAQTLPVEGKFSLITLPYAPNALEPVISERTISLHHGKHLAGYVNNLNKLVVGTKLYNKSLEDVVKRAKGSTYNNAGQLLNHNLYFTQFSPTPQLQPTGRLANAINDQWGSLDNFKKAFDAAGASLFGAGWVWLSKTKSGKLVITQDPNGANPLSDGLQPLLGFDVWEHAYYLDYQNKRADHLKALWRIVDWRIIEERYAQ